VVVELRRVEGATGERLDAYIDVRRIALLRARLVDGSLQTVVLPDPNTEYGIDDMVQLLERLTIHAKSESAERISVRSPSVLVRELARRFGFEGGLRDQLVRSVLGADTRFATSVDDGDDLPQALGRFGVLAAALPSRNPLARMGQRLSSGITSSIEMSVD